MVGLMSEQGSRVISYKREWCWFCIDQVQEKILKCIDMEAENYKVDYDGILEFWRMSLFLMQTSFVHRRIRYH
jgi:hypothetical protein